MPSSSAISSSLIIFIIIVARVVPISSGSTYPRLAVKLPCGSASINNTFFPCLTNPTPRFKVVVLFATPPFWFTTEITLHILFSSIYFSQFSFCQIFNNAIISRFIIAGVYLLGKYL